MKVQYILLGLLVCIAFMGAQQPQEPVLSRIEIEVPSKNQMDEIAEQFEIVAKKGRFLQIITPDVYIKYIEKIAGFKAKILKADIHQKINKQMKDEYPSLQEIESQLKKWASDHPNFVKFERYGSSTSNLPLMALKLSDNPQVDEPEPAILLDASTHGDEVITTKVLLAIMEKLIQGYGVEQRITKLINEKEIWFIPVVSPDGYVRRRRYVGWTDPNRDFPWPEKPQHNSIPCIKHLREFFAQKKFDASVDYHAYGELFMYPWAYTHDTTKSASHFHKLSGGMAKFNNYVYGQISKVIYVAKGSSADYFYWKHGSTALAVEVGRSKSPHGPEIDRVIKENMEAALHFIEFSAKKK